MDYERCGIKHKHGGQTCCRRVGHGGLCRCRAGTADRSGAITYSEWQSRDGEYVRHVRYATTYAKNARARK